MGTGPLVFTGISSFSNDFQTILSRAVSIAQLPVKALQNHQTDNLQKKQILIGLNPVVSNLASSIASLGSIAANQAVAASSSDATKVSVTNTGSTSPATYAITQITSLAAAASETSAAGYADSTTAAVSTAGAKTLELVYGNITKTISLTNQTNNLVGVRDAINNLGIGVTASILTTGTGANPNYLSVSANTPGATSVELLDVASNAGNPDYSAAPVNLLTRTLQASPTPATSVATYADSTTVPVSVAGAKTIELVYGATTNAITLTPATNNLQGVRDAINALGTGITASIVNNGPASYSLSLSAGTPGNTLQLLDITPDNSGNPNYGVTPVSLVSDTNQGSNAAFKLNGVQVTRSSNLVNDMIPGLSFTILAKTDLAQTVSLSLSTDRTQLATAIQAFVQNYNALVDQVDAQMGPSAGLLSGDLLIHNLREDMWQLSTYQGPGSVKSLSDMGVTFDTSGKMSFDQTVFNALSGSEMSDAFKFFGSSTSGFGKLASQFTQLSDPLTGLIRKQEDGYDQTNTQLTNQIATLNDRVAQVQASMTAKLQAADALVAQLQSEQQMITASVQSLNYTLFGYQNNNNGGFTPNSGSNSTTG